MWWFNKVPYHLPKTRGPFVPGCMDISLDYDKSGLFFRLYYPTDAANNDEENCKKWQPCFPDPNYVTGCSKVIMLSPYIIKFFYWKGGAMQIPVLYGEKVKTDNKLKCIIFSHGLGAFRSLYSTICAEMASRGYLVAAIEHRDESACHTYYYKSKEDAAKNVQTSIPYKIVKLGKGHLENRRKQVQYRSEECSRLLDFLLNLNKGVVPYNVLNDVPIRHEVNFNLEQLVGNLDTDTITMCGHSFGGATALLTLSKRIELKQGIILDPWMFSIKDDDVRDKINKPLIFINTQTFHIKSNVAVMEQYMSKNMRTKMYTILGTTHENQGDAVFWAGYWLNWFMKKIDPLTGLNINNSLMLKFLKETTGHDCDIDDCYDTLVAETTNLDEGLTKPWA